MNDNVKNRIDELSQEAWEFSCETPDENGTLGQDSVYTLKFAKLIINDCATIIVSHDQVHTYKDLLKYFKTEEMTNRIFNLDGDAWEFTCDNHDETNLEYNFHLVYSHKFAELIIAEVLMQVEEYSRLDSAVNTDIVVEIKKHFGIE